MGSLGNFSLVMLLFLGTVKDNLDNYVNQLTWDLCNLSVPLPCKK